MKAGVFFFLLLLLLLFLSFPPSFSTLPPAMPRGKKTRGRSRPIKTGRRDAGGMTLHARYEGDKTRGATERPGTARYSVQT